MKHNSRFEHESLQDCESIKRLLNALVAGLSKGKIELEDDEGTMVMEPSGLTNLRITASQDGKKNRLNIRLTWYEDREAVHNKEIRIKSE